MFKKPSKKSAKFPSHEFVRQNAEDIFGSVATLLVMGLMFPPTQELAGKFVFLTPSQNGYSNSVFDAANIFFYALCWVVLSVNVQHFIVNFLTRHTTYSRTKLFDFTMAIHYTVYYISAVSIGVYALLQKYGDNLSVSWVWHDLREFAQRIDEPSTNFYTKLLIHFQISYYLHHFLMVYLLRVQRDFVTKQVLYLLLCLGTLVVAQLVNCFTVLTIILTLHGLEQFLWNLYFCFDVRFKGRVSAFLYFTWNVVFFVTSSSLVVFAAVCLTIDVCAAFAKDSGKIMLTYFSLRFIGLVLLLGTQLTMAYYALSLLVGKIFGQLSSHGTSAEGKTQETLSQKPEDNAHAGKKPTARKRKK